MRPLPQVGPTDPSIAAKVGGWQTYAGGAMPVTLTALFGVAGSLLAMVIVAALAPGEVGWNRMGTATLSPGATATGKFRTCGSWNSPAVEVRPVTSSGHVPPLLIVTGQSLKRFGATQVSPKLPLSVTSVTMRDWPTLACTATFTVRLAGSSLGTVSVADAGPGPVGVNCTCTGKHSPPQPRVETRHSASARRRSATTT